MADERLATVARVVEHAPDVRSLVLALGEPLRFAPGQFLSCKLPVGGETLTRAYSIASAPEATREVEILLSLVPGGPGSAHLFGLRAGDRLRFTGPWGVFALETQPEAETVFVAEGVTIAPIRPMLRRACETGRHPMRLLYGRVPGQPLVYEDEITALAAAHPRFAWEPVESDRLEAAVEELWVAADEDRSRHFYVCGVGDRARRLRRLLRDAGYDRRAVLCERW
jgi:ferredoxin-NADP reductase